MPLFPRQFLLTLLSVGALGLSPCPGQAADLLRCGRFTDDIIAAPEPREIASARQRFEQINGDVRARSYPVIFLGDSLMQRWDEVSEDRSIWNRYFAPSGALNAGINGDRSEHLLWRIEHGNLDNQQPRLAVLLIGTNDLGHGRSIEDAAEGIRAVLVKLRAMLPATRILLQGLWPRADVERLGREIEPVNARLSQCADNVAVFYRDPGRSLLDPEGRLTRGIAPDGLHPSPAGYAKISPEIGREIAELLPNR
jgi:lysophospholipase L1-like esterase